ncbi:MAG: hypothetical protein ACRCUY_12525 [Thermoguttaceae bacterium]
MKVVKEENPPTYVGGSPRFVESCCFYGTVAFTKQCKFMKQCESDYKQIIENRKRKKGKQWKFFSPKDFILACVTQANAKNNRFSLLTLSVL